MPQRHYCEVWRQGFIFLIEWSRADAGGLLRDLGMEAVLPDGCAGGVYYHESDLSLPIVVFVEHLPTPLEVMVTAAHECLHAANLTLARAGVHASWTNDEAQAYLFTWLLKKALEDRCK